MKKLNKFVDIGRFRNVIKEVTDRTRYVGKTEIGEPVFDDSITLPILKFKGTVKLHGCFDKDTLVTLANGEEIPISEVKPGTIILSYDIDKNQYVYSKVNETISQELNKEWIELTFDNNNVINCTTDHLFYTKNRGWVEAKELTEMDEFITPEEPEVETP